MDIRERIEKLAEELYGWAGRYGAHGGVLWEDASGSIQQDYIVEAKFILREFIEGIFGYSLLQPQAPEGLRELLVKTFAQTVEYGAMCSECCSSQGDGDKVLCEMSDKPLKPDDYCPQQIACIENIIPQILALIGKAGYHLYKPEEMRHIDISDSERAITPMQIGDDIFEEVAIKTNKVPPCSKLDTIKWLEDKHLTRYFYHLECPVCPV